jgi:hypothetical protein
MIPFDTPSRHCPEKERKNAELLKSGMAHERGIPLRASTSFGYIKQEQTRHHESTRKKTFSTLMPPRKYVTLKKL